MKVLALTRYSRNGASSRIRTYQYIPALKAEGIDVMVYPLHRDNYLKRLYAKKTTNWFEVTSDYFKRGIRLLSARKFDLIWIEKELFPYLPAWFEHAMSVTGIRYAVDFDDAIFHNYDLSSSSLKRLLSNKIDRVMRDSKLVICGNSYLAERARSAGASQVEIVPTVVDLSRYDVRKPVERKCIVVGWIGSPSTVKYLELVAVALKKLSLEFSIKLRVIGAQFTLSGLNVECHPWSEESEVGEIQDVDIGIMPLTDSPWERGKCGYKLIQYMACGLPVIASPVGVNVEIVRSGVNGYLADSVGDWINTLRNMCEDVTIRQEMGRNGRYSVEQKYSLDVCAPKLAKLFRDVAG